MGLALALAGDHSYMQTHYPDRRMPFFNLVVGRVLQTGKVNLNPIIKKAEWMLGAVKNPELYHSDKALKEVARSFGNLEHFEPTRVGVYFGEPEKVVPDPYFNGEGPERTGCKFCGACMTGCQYNARNTLDKYYLYLAEAMSKVVAGTPFVMTTEAITGTPTTAHILGGCVIERDHQVGVIGRDQKVFGYDNLYVCDGSAISSNPGVNPALTITTMAERVMDRIPGKK